MAEQAGRGAFVPVSLNLRDVVLAAPDWPFGSIGPERAILLPDSPALVCEGGVVVQANLAAARLAGRRLPESLIGLSLSSLLMESGTGAELIEPGGRGTPVRVVWWNMLGAGQTVVFLVDVSDLYSAKVGVRP
ncbi:MAG: hypothetical protein ACRD0H_17830 [Actinomycetes bacterium]